MGDAVFEGLDLCVDTYLCGRQSRDAHLHLDELYPTRLLRLRGHLLHLTDRCLGEVLDTKFRYQPVDNFFLNRSFHFIFFFAMDYRTDNTLFLKVLKSCCPLLIFTFEQLYL